MRNSINLELQIIGAAACVALLAGAANAQDKPNGRQRQTHTVQVNLHEWAMGLGGRTVVPGDTARFEIRNTGKELHSLEIEGKIEGKEVEIVSQTLKPGESTSLTISLPAGEYMAYCPISNHADRGMRVKIVFQGAKSAK